MDSSQEGEDRQELAEEVLDSVGVAPDATDEINQSQADMGRENMGDPLYVQKRLKQQKRSHDREMREMHARMAEMQAQFGSPQSPQSFDANPNVPPGGYSQGGMDETISKAVSFALRQREMEEQKARAAEGMAKLSRKYDELNSHLDSVSDKYEDFDDIVRGNHVPITPSMRDAAILLPKKGAGSAGEVLYKLGKNPQELSRISKLLPHEQAEELVALSHALISGGGKPAQGPRPLGNVKANPVTNSVGVTEKTSPSEIRALMKAGKFR